MADLTILVPIFNEEEGISRLEASFSSYFSKTFFSVKVVLIDDGSTDSSLNEIRRLCEKDPRFSYLSIKKNSGLSAVLKIGIDSCHSPWVGYIDADLQTSPEDFLLFEPFIQEYDLVMGSRTERKDTLTKKLTSKLANGFRDLILHDGVTDSGCPLKIMKTEMAQSLPSFKGMHRFFPALVQMMGGKVYQLPVRHFPRQTGYSKFNFKNRLLGPIIDMFAVRWMQSKMIRKQIEETRIHELISQNS